MILFVTFRVVNLLYLVFYVSNICFSFVRYQLQETKLFLVGANGINISALHLPCRSEFV